MSDTNCLVRTNENAMGDTNFGRGSLQDSKNLKSARVFAVLLAVISGRGWSATAQPPSVGFAIQILSERMVKTAASSPTHKP